MPSGSDLAGGPQAQLPRALAAAFAWVGSAPAERTPAPGEPEPGGGRPAPPARSARPGHPPGPASDVATPRPSAPPPGEATARLEPWAGEPRSVPRRSAPAAAALYSTAARATEVRIGTIEVELVAPPPPVVVLPARAEAAAPARLARDFGSPYGLRQS